MDYVNGEDRILYVQVNGIYMPVGCLTGNGISETTSMLDTTTSDNEGWETFRPTSQGYSISFSGLQINTTAYGGNFVIASYDRLKILKRDRALINWKIQGKKFPIVDYGKAYISDISETSNVGEFLSFSGTMTGYGKPLIQELAGVLLNNGDPNTVVATENNELIKVS